MIQRRMGYRVDLRLLFCLAGICVCVFTGCPHPSATHSLAGFHKIQQHVKTLEARGIKVDLDLLKPGAKYFQKFRLGKIPADEAWQRYGAEMFRGSQGKVTCVNHCITVSDLELLAELPALEQFVFIQCTWANEAGKTPESSKGLAGATSLSFHETPAPDWLLNAPTSTRLSVTLQAAELSPEMVAAALKNKNVSSLKLISNSSVDGAFAGLPGSGVTTLIAELPVFESGFQQIRRCESLTHLTLSAESPVDAEVVGIVAAMDQMRNFQCTLAGDTDLRQVTLDSGKWEYCGLSPAGNGITHFSLSRDPRYEALAAWPDDTPATRAAKAALLPAPVSPRLSAPESNVWMEPLKQRITFSRLKSANDIRYASSLPDIREIRFGFGEVEVNGSELATEFQQLPHIHTVDLQWKFSRRSEVIAALASLPNLQILKISGPAGEEFAELQKLTRLQRLEIYAQSSQPGKDILSLPPVPELAIRNYLLADTLAEFLEDNKSARVELQYHNKMPVSSLSAAANSDLQQLVLVPIVAFPGHEIAALRSAFPGYRTEVLKGGGVAHIFSRGG